MFYSFCILNIALTLTIYHNVGTSKDKNHTVMELVLYVQLNIDITYMAIFTCDGN